MAAKDIQKYKFKPGQSGNPSGRPKEDPEVKRLRALTKNSFKELAELIITCDRAKILEMIKNPESTALEVWLAKVAAKGIKNADYRLLDDLLNRLIGRVKEEVDVTVKKGDELVAKLIGDRRKDPPEHK